MASNEEDLLSIGKETAEYISGDVFGFHGKLIRIAHQSDHVVRG